ncbi:MAG: FAD-dependent oxidoreductase, partial [Rhodoferax sp.]
MRAADPACVQAAQDRSPKAIPPGWRNPVPRGRYDLLVVGAGPAGLVAARTAAAAGAKVALVEGRQIGGNCIHEGCIPSKTLIRSASLYADMRDAAEFGVQAPTDIAVDFGAAMARVQRIRVRLGRTISPAVLTAEGIDLHFGYARFVGPDAVEVAGSTLRFKKALIATGSRPVWPQIDGLAEAGFLNNETVFDL